MAFEDGLLRETRHHGGYLPSNDKGDGGGREFNHLLLGEVPIQKRVFVGKDYNDTQIKQSLYYYAPPPPPPPPHSMQYSQEDVYAATGAEEYIAHLRFPPGISAELHFDKAQMKEKWNAAEESSSYDFIENDSNTSSLLDDCNVFVKYLPSDLSDSDFYKMFKSFGNIISSKIMVDQGTGKSLGYGFVRYSNSAASQKAIHHMNGHRISNKRLLCKLANLSPSSYNSEFSKNPLLNSQTPNDNIYIKPLHKDTSEEDLRKLFGKFGNIIDCKVMIDRNTGVSRQIGFVRFQTQQQALNAIHQMNNFKLHPSAPPLTVKFADTKEQKNARKALRQKQSKSYDESPQSPVPSSPPVSLASSSLLPSSHPLSLPLSLPLPIPILPVPSSSFYYPPSPSSSPSSSPSPTGTEYYFPSPPTQAYFPLSSVGVPQEQEEPIYYPTPPTVPSTSAQSYPPYIIDGYYNSAIFPQTEFVGYGGNYVDLNSIKSLSLNEDEVEVDAKAVAPVAVPARNAVIDTNLTTSHPPLLYGNPAFVEAYSGEEAIDKLYVGDLIYYPYLESDHYYPPEESIASSPLHKMTLRK